MNLPIFKYSFFSGPLTINELDQEIKEGNCRLAVQLYFYKIHNVYFEPEQILNPNGFKNTGEFVFNIGENIDFNNAEVGDVIYAENLMNKKREPINKGRDVFESEDGWILHFHTAIYLGNDDVWHATNFQENSGVWSLDKFKEFYKPVAIKRFLM